MKAIIPAFLTAALAVPASLLAAPANAQQAAPMDQSAKTQSADSAASSSPAHSTSAAGQPAHDQPPEAVAQTESTKAYMKAMEDMGHGMATPYTGDPDVDFMRGMIPHHKGAVAMAEVVVKYGKDPQVRMMAEKMIRDQQAEITMMTDWLKANVSANANPNATAAQNATPAQTEAGTTPLALQPAADTGASGAGQAPAPATQQGTDTPMPAKPMAKPAVPATGDSGAEMTGIAPKARPVAAGQTADTPPAAPASTAPEAVSGQDVQTPATASDPAMPAASSAGQAASEADSENAHATH